MRYIDTHAHLQMDRYNEDVHVVIEESFESGCEGIFIVGYDVESSEKAVKLALLYDKVYAIVGVHPHDAEKEIKRDYLKEIENLTKEEKVIGIGEIGLDFYYNWSPKDIQVKVFRDQIELAISINLPITLHIRNAYKEVFEITEKYEHPFLVHSFTGNKSDADIITQRGYYYSINGIVTFKNSTIKEIIPTMNINKMVVETDSPYLSPHPKRGKRNSPAYIPFIIEKIADILSVDKEELAETLIKNTEAFWNV